MADDRMVGKMGRVSSAIKPKVVGEVMVPVRGGTEHFHAYAADDDDHIEKGARIVVVEYHPPRTVIVTRM